MLAFMCAGNICMKHMFHDWNMWLHDGWCNYRLNTDINHRLIMLHACCNQCNAWNICWITYNHICIWLKLFHACCNAWSHITIYVYASMHETYVGSYTNTCAKRCITIHETCVRLFIPHRFHICLKHMHETYVPCMKHMFHAWWLVQL